VAADLDILSRNYDAVLVDLGELEIEAAARTPLGQAIRSRLDAVVLVQSVRSTTPDRLERLQEKLAEAGVACAGTIQNFVAGE
jgi:Mrp family chromosome partitioning ATPase